MSEKLKKKNFVYDVIADIDELKWFYDHVVVKPEQGESLMICHSARRKHCTPEEIQELQLGRAEMFHTEISKPRPNQAYNWNDFIGTVYKLECNKQAYTTKTYQPYPEKTLVSFMYLNPCSEADSVMDTVRTFMEMAFDGLHSGIKKSWKGVEDSVYKFSTLTNHIKSCHAQNPSRKEIIDFDIDWTIEESDYPLIHEITEKWFGKKNFFMVKTAGGMHVFVKHDALHFNPYDYTAEIKEKLVKATSYEKCSDVTKGDVVWLGDKIYRALNDTKARPPAENQKHPDWEVLGEVTKNDNTMCAIPGTWQYGTHCVRVVNKEDFE